MNYNYTGTSLIREPKGKKIKNSDEVADEIRMLIGEDINKKEFFCLITLDNLSKIIKSRIIHIGTLDKAIVHQRDIFNPVLIDNAAAFIIAHNHPSGSLNASNEDKKITKRMQEASKIIGIDLLDHVIVTELGFLSFSDKDLL